MSRCLNTEAIRVLFRRTHADNGRCAVTRLSFLRFETWLDSDKEPYRAKDIMEHFCLHFAMQFRHRFQQFCWWRELFQWQHQITQTGKASANKIVLYQTAPLRAVWYGTICLLSVAIYWKLEWPQLKKFVTKKYDISTSTSQHTVKPEKHLT